MKTTAMNNLISAVFSKGSGILAVFFLPAMTVFYVPGYTQAQGVAINTTGAAPSGSAALDVDMSDKGVLIPRVSLSSTSVYGLAGGGPTNSMLVYNTNPAVTGQGAFGEGFYYWRDTVWIKFWEESNPPPAWLLTGNAGTVDTVHFLGTVDGRPLNFRVNNQRSGRIDTLGSVYFGSRAGNAYVPGTPTRCVGIGEEALRDNTSGARNTAVGYWALRGNTTQHGNIAIGREALVNNQGESNIAVGRWAMQYNSTGSFNVGIGDRAIGDVTNSGNENIAIGHTSLANNTSGSYNLAVGGGGLSGNQAGSFNTSLGSNNLGVAAGTNPNSSLNTMVGHRILYYCTTSNSNFNVVCGDDALFYPSFAVDNVFMGLQAGIYNSSGNNRNTVFGAWAFGQIPSGCSENSIIGWRAGASLDAGCVLNVFVGRDVQNKYIWPPFYYLNRVVFLGALSSFAGVARNNVAVIGFNLSESQCTGDNQVLLGNTAVSQIRAAVGSITAYSDARYKSEVTEDIRGLDFVLRLRPVSYNVNPELLHQIWGTPDSLLKNLDHTEIKQQRFLGFLAQEVEQAAKEAGFAFTGIDVPRNEKETYSLRYTDFIMPLVKSVQEQQHRITELQEKNQKLREKHAALMRELNESVERAESLRNEAEELKNRMGALRAASFENRQGTFSRSTDE